MRYTRSRVVCVRFTEDEYLVMTLRSFALRQSRLTQYVRFAALGYFDYWPPTQNEIDQARKSTNNPFDLPYDEEFLLQQKALLTSAETADYYASRFPLGSPMEYYVPRLPDTSDDDV